MPKQKIILADACCLLDKEELALLPGVLLKATLRRDGYRRCSWWRPFCAAPTPRAFHSFCHFGRSCSSACAASFALLVAVFSAPCRRFASCSVCCCVLSASIRVNAAVISEAVQTVALPAGDSVPRTIIAQDRTL